MEVVPAQTPVNTAAAGKSLGGFEGTGHYVALPPAAAGMSAGSWRFELEALAVLTAAAAAAAAAAAGAADAAALSGASERQSLIPQRTSAEAHAAAPLKSHSPILPLLWPPCAAYAAPPVGAAARRSCCRNRARRGAELLLPELHKVVVGRMCVMHDALHIALHMKSVMGHLSRVMRCFF
jgi:hypothetical protein